MADRSRARHHERIVATGSGAQMDFALSVSAGCITTRVLCRNRAPAPFPRVTRSNGRASLAVAGLHFCHIVEMTTYHVGLRKHLDVFVKIKDEFVRSPYPAWTAIGVTELITQGTLLEVRVVAKRESD
jgi:hypothetical protein